MTPKRITTVRLDDEVFDGLQEIRERDGVPVSEQVRRALKLWLESKGVKKTAKPARGKRAGKA